jgi:transcriptional regulator GlxA family with amidase domain
LLVTTDMPVNEIARAVGFSDARYFSRVFGQAEGVTPTEYRNRSRSVM